MRRLGLFVVAVVFAVSSVLAPVRGAAQVGAVVGALGDVTGVLSDAAELAEVLESVKIIKGKLDTLKIYKDEINDIRNRITDVVDVYRTVDGFIDKYESVYNRYDRLIKHIETSPVFSREGLQNADQMLTVTTSAIRTVGESIKFTVDNFARIKDAILAMKAPDIQAIIDEMTSQLDQDMKDMDFYESLLSEYETLVEFMDFNDRLTDILTTGVDVSDIPEMDSDLYDAILREAGVSRERDEAGEKRAAGAWVSLMRVLLLVLSAGCLVVGFLQKSVLDGGQELSGVVLRVGVVLLSVYVVFEAIILFIH